MKKEDIKVSNRTKSIRRTREDDPIDGFLRITSFILNVEWERNGMLVCLCVIEREEGYRGLTVLLPDFYKCKAPKGFFLLSFPLNPNCCVVVVVMFCHALTGCREKQKKQHRNQCDQILELKVTQIFQYSP